MCVYNNPNPSSIMIIPINKDADAYTGVENSETMKNEVVDINTSTHHAIPCISNE